MRELNLIPYEIKEKEEKSNKNKRTILAAALAAAVVFAAVFFPIAYSNIVKGKEIRLKNEVESKKYILTEYNQIESSISAIKAHISIADNIDKSKVYINTVITNLSLLTPGAVSFTNLTYLNGGISISAESKDYNSIFEFTANLETSEDFTTAKLNTVNYNKDKGSYTFSLTIPQKEVVKK